MLFHTLPFVILLAVTIALVALIRGATSRKVILLLASYTFYGWWSIPLLAPLLFTTFLDYFIAQRIEAEQRDARRRALLIFSLAANLGLLGFFKYYDFFAGAIGAPLAGVLLPIGISFYTFHTMSYTIDVYRREIRACRSPLDFALFIAFFPVLIAGPILRAKQFLPQLQRRVTLQFSPSILFLFVRGLAKKVLVADNLAMLIDNVFAAPSRWPSVVIWIATIAFAIQIYCDFSGYSDMARALARLFGFEIPLNFDHPYAAGNPREFWRRWHISLSTWLRDYLYIPLGGNRRHRMRNLMITMILGGLWHGASWNFVLWGAMHGLLLGVERRPLRPPAPEAGAAPLIRRIVFYYCLLLTWIAFRVRDFDAMFIAMKKFVLFDFDFSLAHRGLTGLYFVTTVALIALFFAVPRDLDERLARMPFAAQAAACTIIGAAFVLFWPNASAPFIYFQF
jgi:alginate O-acetyltransferase complex protein AlgI